MALELNTLYRMKSFTPVALFALWFSLALTACSGRSKPYSHPDLEKEQAIARQSTTPAARLANETKLALTAIMSTRVALLQAFQPDIRVTPCGYPVNLKKDVDAVSFDLGTSCMRWGSPQITFVGTESFLGQGAGAHRRGNLPDSYDFKSLTIAPKADSGFSSNANPTRAYNLSRNLKLIEANRGSGQTTYTITATEHIVLPKTGAQEAVDFQMTLSGKVTVNFADLSFAWDNVRVLSKTTKGEEKSQLVFAGSQLLDMGNCVRPKGKGGVEQSKDGVTDLIKSSVVLGENIELTEANSSTTWENCAAGNLPALRNFIAAVTALGL